MKASDRKIFIGLVVVALVAGFWFFVLSPKRSEVAKLDTEIAALESSAQAAEQLAIVAEQAEDRYRANFHRLVVLGKAVPSDDDTASLFVELEALADSAGVSLDSIALNDAGAGEAPPPPLPTEAPPATEGEEPAEGATPVGATPAPATEAAAATLPLGATVGPAGLPVMPYTLKLRGDYFELANFLAGIDRLVSARRGRQVIDGRLVTIDGFGFAADTSKGFPKLTASLAITTFVSPADEGATAGAIPSDATGAPAAPPPVPTSTAPTP
jgi:Tfp pilus assembly protein PilO